MRGKFVTIEGCDGSGKSTQIELMRSSLTALNVDFVFTREPGGTEISERIRDIISSPAYSNMDDYTELLLYAAARRQHVVKLKELLSEGKLVICDRFTDSTVAYQGYGRGIDMTTINFCNNIATDGLNIDLTLFFDLPPDEAFARKGGADRGDRLECEEFDFYTRVYEGYKRLSEGDRFEVVDARKSIEEVHAFVMTALKRRGII